MCKMSKTADLSSVTSCPVTAPCGVTMEKAAARAHTMATATRTTFGQALRETIVTGIAGLIRGYLALMNVVLLQMPVLCAVSWMWMPLEEDTSLAGLGKTLASETQSVAGTISGYGTLQCNWKNTNSNCPGAAGGNCFPYAIWSGAPRETDYYSGFHFVSGSLTMSGACEGTGKCSYTNAFTVRCVLVLNYYKARYRSANELSESSVFTHRTNLKTSSAMNSPVMAPCGAVQQLATARALLLVPMMLTTATRSPYGLHSQAAIRTL